MKKRHHFVPQFYLRKFAATEPAEEIWTYDVELGECRKSDVGNTAFEKYLYSVTLDDGTRIDDLENLIAKIEDKAAPILEKLILDAPVTDQERADFASFIAIMYVRTDAFRLQFAQIMTSHNQLQMYATAKHEGAFRSFIKEYERDRGALSESEIEDIRQGMLNPQDFIVSVDKEWTLRALKFHDRFAPIFYGMNWSLLKIDPPRYLITTDNPLVFEVPSADRHPFYGGGLLHGKVELTFPLSSNACLYGTWQDHLPKSLSVSPEIAKGLNRHRAIYAKRFLFGPRFDAGIRRLGAKYKDKRPGIQVSGFGPDEYSPVELRRRNK